MDLLKSKTRLPCGLELDNVLIKTAMAECLARLDGLPNELHCTLYEQWSASSYSVVITGNVQVDDQYLGLPFDVFIRKTNRSDHAWKRWAESCNVPTLVQLCHVGRQSLRGLKRWPWEPPIAPSAIPIRPGASFMSRLLTSLLLGTPRQATVAELQDVTNRFVHAAQLMHHSGFAGVQLHAAHGYLLSQMMSPATNKRSDDYGRDPKARLKLLFDIISGIRASVPSTFCLSVKLNSADYVQGGLTEEDALEQLTWILDHGGVDIVEISGGTYESIAFAADKASDNKREAFFASFARQAKTLVAERTDLIAKPSILLTGGFRTRAGMVRAIEAGDTDLIGIARPACVDHDFPQRLLDASVPDAEAACVEYTPTGVDIFDKLVPVKFVGAGAKTLWHTFQLHRVARGKRVARDHSFLRLACDALIMPAILPILLIALTSFGLVFRISKTLLG